MSLKMNVTLKQIIEDDTEEMTGAKLVAAMGDQELWSSKFVRVSPMHSDVIG